MICNYRASDVVGSEDVHRRHQRHKRADSTTANLQKLSRPYQYSDQKKKIVNTKGTTKKMPTAVITGANSGIGNALAHILVKEVRTTSFLPM